MILGMALLFPFRESTLFCSKCTYTHTCTMCMFGVVGTTMVRVGQLSLLFMMAALTDFYSHCIAM